MNRDSTGLRLNVLTFSENIDLSKEEKITNIVELSILPKALGGGRISKGKEQTDAIGICDFCSKLELQIK